MFKSVRKNLRYRNSRTLKQLVLCGIVTSSLTFNGGVSFAEESTPPKMASQRQLQTRKRRTITKNIIPATKLPQAKKLLLLMVLL